MHPPERWVNVQWLGVMPRLDSYKQQGTVCPMVGRYAPLGFQKSLKPRNTLYTWPSEPQPDRRRT